MSEPSGSEHAKHPVLSGAYALDALDEEERAAFERHLRTCATCAQEVAGFRATTARLAGAVEHPPPPGLEARVLARAAATAQLPPVGTAPVSWLRARRRAALPVAASVLLALAVSLGGVVLDQQRRLEAASDGAQRAARIEAVLDDPARRTLTAPGPTGSSGTVVVASGSALVLLDGLPSAPAGRDYQLWVLEPGATRSAGLLGAGGGSSAALVVDGVDPDDALALTLEPDGGSAQPTTAPAWSLRV